MIAGPVTVIRGMEPALLIEIQRQQMILERKIGEAAAKLCLTTFLHIGFQQRTVFHRWDRVVLFGRGRNVAGEAELIDARLLHQIHHVGKLLIIDFRHGHAHYRLDSRRAQQRKNLQRFPKAARHTEPVMGLLHAVDGDLTGNAAGVF